MLSSAVESPIRPRCGSLVRIASVALLLISCDGTVMAQNARGSVRAACKQDVETVCSGVQPGGDRIAACMRQNAAKLSPQCRSAIAQAEQR